MLSIRRLEGEPGIHRHPLMAVPPEQSHPFIPDKKCRPHPCSRKAELPGKEIIDDVRVPTVSG